MQVSGEYFFEDGLKWEQQQWRYLSKQKGERRYYTEQLSAIPPAGLSKRHDREPPPNVPIGKYDTGNAPSLADPCSCARNTCSPGDGFFDPESNSLCEPPLP